MVKEMSRMFKWSIRKYLFNTNEGCREGRVPFTRMDEKVIPTVFFTRDAI